MRVSTLPAATVAKATRLDAGYFTAPGIVAADRMETLTRTGVETYTIEQVGEVEHVTRFKRVLAASEEPSVPFLRAFDVFEYLPEPADRLSKGRTPDLATLMIEPGVILVTRSGRNLGPCVLADDYLAGFVPSDDLLRVRIADVATRLFTFAFLSSPSGQNLLRQDRTGSVIAHLSAGQVEKQTIPVLTDVFDDVVALVAESHKLQGAARKTLQDAVRAIDSASPRRPTSTLAKGWSVTAASLAERFDAAFHQEWLAESQQTIVEQGGARLGDVARVTKPGGRYKTNYVSADHGRPLLSGRQLLQFLPIGQKYLAASVLRDAAPYELKSGMIAFQADGRAEESLGQPVMVTPDRDGWLSSGHAGRALPRDPVDAGWIWASMASRVVREQIAAIACGSVVDALYEVDLENVVLPDRSTVDSKKVIQAWIDFDRANDLMAQAMDRIEQAFYGSS